MNILVTTLGKGERREGGYRVAKYRLPDGSTSRETPFIGLALVEMLPQIDKLVVLGTAGSIWDAWWQCDEKLLEANEEFFVGLGEKVKYAERDEMALDRLSAILATHLQKEVECKYIPDGLDESSQLDIMKVIDAVGMKGDNIYLDVTHGFRHLPMLELLSAFLKKSEFNVCKIFYGALEKSEAGIAPVADLSGLLNLQTWIEAMAVVRETGNVTLLAKIPSMRDFQSDLEQYQFFVQMNNIGNARGCANRIRGLINANRLPQEGVLFKNQLLAMFDWGVDRNYPKRQLAQAKAAMASGDFLRAIILLNEAAISAWVEDANRVMDPGMRNKAADRLFNDGGEEWHVLRRLRNSTAHDGVRNDYFERKIKTLRSCRENFENGMRNIVKWVEKQVERASRELSR